MHTQRKRTFHCIVFAVVLSGLVPRPARAQFSPFSPPSAAEPAAAPGSASDPNETAEQASPAAAERYPSAASATGPSIGVDEQRTVPDYSPRAAEDTAQSGWLWAPRAVFFPVYLVSEYVVRRPLGATLSYAESNRWIGRLIEFFTWDERRAGLVPSVAVDYGFRPNAGLYLFWDRFLARSNDVRLSGDFGGIHWATAQLTDRVTLPNEQQISLRGYFSTRLDHMYWGLGSESSSDELRFGATDLEGSLNYQALGWRNSRLSAAVGGRRVRFDSGSPDVLRPTLDQALASGQLAELPPGVDGYATVYQSLEAVLDTRPLRAPRDLPDVSDFLPQPGTGTRLAVGVRHVNELEGRGSEPVAAEWVNCGVSVGGYIDVTGLQRTLGLTVSTLFADPLHGGDSIPFTELPSLGGNDLMRGFRPLRLIGRSALAAELNYRWPIWALLDGNIDVGVGNVFGERLAGATWDKLRLGADIGVRTLGSIDHPFEVLFGIGTQTFAEGASIDSVRLVFGTSSEF